MKRKRYIVKYTTRAFKQGDVVYQKSCHDYGLASDDTRMTGIEHVSVSEKESGDYPLATVEFHALQEGGFVED